MLSNHCNVTVLLRRLQVNIQVFKIIKLNGDVFKNWLCPNFLSLPKKSELPKIWGGCSPLAPPARTPMGVWIFSRTTQFGKFGITVICVSSCFRYPLLKLRQCLGHHRVPSSDTKVNSDLGIPFLYYASV